MYGHSAAYRTSSCSYFTGDVSQALVECVMRCMQETGGKWQRARVRWAGRASLRSTLRNVSQANLAPGMCYFQGLGFDA